MLIIRIWTPCGGKVVCTKSKGDQNRLMPTFGN